MKIVIDVFMMLLLFALSGYQFLSASMHKWLGIMIFVCFILHNALNFNWYKNVIKGNYSTIRMLYLIINALILIAMFVQMYSGIAMSRYVFPFLKLSGTMSFVRRLHILGAYWGFVLIGLHLGMHWNSFIKRIWSRKRKHMKSVSKLSCVIGIVIALYGLYAFFKRHFPTYLFLKSEFVFMDFNEYSLFFYIDYIAIMGLCIFISNYAMKFLLNKKTIESRKTI